MSRFENIKVGDKVGFRDGLRDDIFTVAEVTNVTPKCFDVGSARFYKNTGAEKGARSLYFRVALTITPEFLEAKAKAETEDGRKKLARTLSELLGDLSIKKLRAIKEIVTDQTDTAQHT